MHVCIVYNRLNALVLSLDQFNSFCLRPRNYLSCCCSWIFRLIYALSTPTTLLPLHFPPLSSLLPPPLTPHLPLSLSLTPPSCIINSHHLATPSFSPSLLTSPSPSDTSPTPLSLSHSSLMHYQLPPPCYPFIFPLSPHFSLPL